MNLNVDLNQSYESNCEGAAIFINLYQHVIGSIEGINGSFLRYIGSKVVFKDIYELYSVQEFRNEDSLLLSTQIGSLKYILLNICQKM